MIKNCQLCGREFIAQRSTAKFCSDACRQRHCRGVLVAPLNTPKLRPNMPKDEILQIIDNAHSTAADLSRAAMFSKQPVSGKLHRIGKKLEDALRGEGL